MPPITRLRDTNIAIFDSRVFLRGNEWRRGAVVLINDGDCNNEITANDMTTSVTTMWRDKCRSSSGDCDVACRTVTH